MNKLKVIAVTEGDIQFEEGVKLYSNHFQDCCESHDLTLSDLTIEDFEGLEFDLTNDNFFRRVPYFGIELIPVNGFSVKIPGHGSNNGYYSHNLDLIIEQNGQEVKRYDISECQDVSE